MRKNGGPSGGKDKGIILFRLRPRLTSLNFSSILFSSRA